MGAQWAPCLGRCPSIKAPKAPKAPRPRTLGGSLKAPQSASRRGPPGFNDCLTYQIQNSRIYRNGLIVPWSVSPQITAAQRRNRKLRSKLRTAAAAAARAAAPQQEQEKTREELREPLGEPLREPLGDFTLSHTPSLSLSLSIYIYIYPYIHTYMVQQEELDEYFALRIEKMWQDAYELECAEARPRALSMRP